MNKVNMRSGSLDESHDPPQLLEQSAKTECHSGTETNHCLIICNYSFEEKKKDFLKGSDGKTAYQHDVINLKKVFKKLNYREPKVEENKDSEQIIQIIAEWCDDRKPSDKEAIFVIILSHGSEYGEILGRDCKDIKLNDIIKQVCEKHQGIPKIFIVQACRGEMDDERKIEQCASSNAANAVRETTIPTSASGATIPTSASLNEIQGKYRDLFVYYPSRPDHKCYVLQQTNNVTDQDGEGAGSLLIKTLCNKLDEKPDLSLWELVTKVNYTIAHMKIRLESKVESQEVQTPEPRVKYVKQCPEAVSTLCCNYNFTTGSQTFHAQFPVKDPLKDRKKAKRRCFIYTNTNCKTHNTEGFQHNKERAEDTFNKLGFEVDNYNDTKEFYRMQQDIKARVENDEDEIVVFIFSCARKHEESGQVKILYHKENGKVAESKVIGMWLTDLDGNCKNAGPRGYPKIVVMVLNCCDRERFTQHPTSAAPGDDSQTEFDTESAKGANTFTYSILLDRETPELPKTQFIKILCDQLIEQKETAHIGDIAHRVNRELRDKLGELVVPRVCSTLTKLVYLGRDAERWDDKNRKCKELQDEEKKKERQQRAKEDHKDEIQNVSILRFCYTMHNWGKRKEECKQILKNPKDQEAEVTLKSGKAMDKLEEIVSMRGRIKQEKDGKEKKLDELYHRILKIWDNCFALDSKIESGRANQESLHLISLIVEKYKEEGVQVFNDYDIKSHAKFFDIEVSDKGKEEFSTTTLIFLPTKSAVIIIKEVCHRKKQNPHYELRNVLENIPEDIELFLKIHCEHLKDDITIIPIISQPHFDTKCAFDLCCDQCEPRIFFKEDLTDEEKVKEKWKQEKEKRETGMHRIEEELLYKEPGERTDRSYDKMVACTVAYMSTKDAYLPNPLDTESAYLTKIFLSRNQHDILHSKQKHVFVSGWYGSGKSLLIQLKLIDLMKNISTVIPSKSHKIYFVSFNNMSLLDFDLREAVKRIKAYHADHSLLEPYIGTIQDMRKKLGLDTVNLVSLLEKIANENEKSGYISHLIGDEYDTAEITDEIAPQIKKILQRPSMKESFVWIAFLPMFKKRTHISPAGLRSDLEHGNRLDEVKEYIRPLNIVFRCTEQIFDLVSTAIEVLKHESSTFEWSDLQDQVAEQGDVSDTRNKSDEKGRNIPSSVTKETEQDIAINEMNENKAEEKEQEIMIKDNDALDYAYKDLQDNGSSSDINKHKIETNVEFFGSVTTQSCEVSGDKPMLVTFKNEGKPDEDVSLDYWIYLFLVQEKIVQKQDEGLAMICSNTSELEICEKALRKANIKHVVYAPRLKKDSVKPNIYCNGEKVILTDADGCTGLQFAIVIVLITRDESFLSFLQPRSISRAMNKLYLLQIPNTSVSQSDSHQAKQEKGHISSKIVDEWIKKKKVQRVEITMESECDCTKAKMMWHIAPEREEEKEEEKRKKNACRTYYEKKHRKSDGGQSTIASLDKSQINKMAKQLLDEKLADVPTMVDYREKELHEVPADVKPMEKLEREDPLPKKESPTFDGPRNLRPGADKDGSNKSAIFPKRLLPHTPTSRSSRRFSMSSIDKTLDKFFGRTPSSKEPAPPASYEDEVRRRVLDKVVKPTITNHTEEEMNKDRAVVVFGLAYKFRLNEEKIQEIRDAGGDNTIASFFKILLKSETSIDEVSEALEMLTLKRAKEEWDRITEDKEMSDLELHNVQPMYRYLKRDAELPFAISWVHLADSLDYFPQDKIVALKESIKTGNQFSAAGALLTHLTKDQVTVGRFLEKLNEVDQDRTMTSCKNVIKKVEADIEKAIAYEIEKDKTKNGNR